MKKKLIVIAAVLLTSQICMNMMAFPSWHELRAAIINYYKTSDGRHWAIDDDGDLEITYTDHRGTEHVAYIMMPEAAQALPDIPPAVCYFESVKPANCNTKKGMQCADAINWALPGMGFAYYNDGMISISSSIYAFDTESVIAELPQLELFSARGIDIAATSTDYVAPSYFSEFTAPGFTDFGNRVVKLLDEKGFKSACEVSNEVVEFDLVDTKIRISPQGYSLGGRQFVTLGTSFSTKGLGVKAEKAAKKVAEQMLKLSCAASRIVVSTDDDMVMVVATMSTTDKSLEEDLKRCLAPYAIDAAVTAQNVKNALAGK